MLLRLAVVVTVAGALAAPGASAHVRNGQIAFGRLDDPDTQLWVVNPDGSGERQIQPIPALPPALECPRWSPDGRLIATCGSPLGGESVIINPLTGRYRGLLEPNPGLTLGCNAWSPDGRRLACATFNDQLAPNLIGLYTVRSSDGGAARRVTSGPDEQGDYSPDGRRIVFRRFDTDGNPIGLFTVGAGGGPVRAVTPPGTLLSADSLGDWSPDGKWIVYARHVTTDVHSTIWMIHPDGSGLRPVTVQGVACGGADDDPNGIGCADPRWSPDGRKIVFVYAVGADRDVATVNADGTGFRQLTHGGTDHFPDWGARP